MCVCVCVYARMYAGVYVIDRGDGVCVRVCVCGSTGELTPHSSSI